MHRIYIALGSNLEKPSEQIQTPFDNNITISRLVLHRQKANFSIGLFKHYSLYTDILINSIILDTYMQENNRGCMKYNSLV